MVQKHRGLLEKSLPSSPKLNGTNGLQKLDFSLNSHGSLKLWL